MPEQARDPLSLSERVSRAGSTLRMWAPDKVEVYNIILILFLWGFGSPIRVQRQRENLLASASLIGVYIARAGNSK